MIGMPFPTVIEIPIPGKIYRSVAVMFRSAINDHIPLNINQV